MSEQQNQLAVPQRWGTGELRRFITSENMMAQIRNALPKHVRPEQFVRVMLTTLQKNPKLAECSPASFLGSLLDAAQLGLMISGPLGQAHLVPFKGTAQLILGYTGKIDLAFRSGRVAGLDFDFVCEGDTFEYERGSNSRLKFVRKARPMGRDGGYSPEQVIGAWAAAKVGGEPVFVALTKGDIDAARSRSAAVRNGKTDSPWFTDYGAMAAKTAVHRLAKRLPLSPEIQSLIAREDAIEIGELELNLDATESAPVEEPQRRTRRTLPADPPPPASITPEEAEAIRESEAASAAG